MELITSATGFTEKIDNFKSRIPDFDPRSGEHLWSIIGMWKFNPNTSTEGVKFFLDHESLMSVEGPGCYYCERPYSPILASRRCKGVE